jgi:hypothetical protein
MGFRQHHGGRTCERVDADICAEFGELSAKDGVRIDVVFVFGSELLQIVFEKRQLFGHVLGLAGGQLVTSRFEVLFGGVVTLQTGNARLATHGQRVKTHCYGRVQATNKGERRGQDRSDTRAAQDERDS